MKKLITVFAIATLFMVSTVFMACNHGNSPSESSESVPKTDATLGTGQVMGYVLDNRGTPVEGATVTLGAKQVKTNSGGEFVIPDVYVNDTSLVTAGASVIAGTSTTAYTLTATKDGYLPAKVTGVFVTYEEIQTNKAAAYATALAALEADYKALLTSYAAALGTGSASTATAVTAQSDDTISTVTQSTTTNADEVYKTIADAMAALLAEYGKDEYYTNYFATFASATMIPCDASFAGSIKLNLTTKGASEISATTYVPTSKPTVVVTYKPTSGSDANYRFEAQADENGYFKFDKCLPSGVSVQLSIDSFFEKIGEGDDAPVYVFSSESSDLMIENSSAGILSTVTTGTAAAPTAISMDSINGQKSAVFMLYAQNDKIWIVDTNITEASKGTLLKTTDALTFKFSKAMKVVNFTAPSIKDIVDGNITTVLKDGGKTAEVTPVDGNWTLVSGATDFKVTVSGEAVDGAKTIINDKFTPYFDTNIWVGLDTTAVKSFDDVDGLRPLDDSVVLTFSKPMTDFVEVGIKYETATAGTYASVPNIYTKTWSEDYKTLTIKPDTYWEIPNGNALVFSVTKGKAADGTDTIKYWKTGVKTVTDTSSSTPVTSEIGLEVFFNNFVDVKLADASTDTQEAFTITFSKEIKAFDEKKDLTVKYWDASLTTPAYVAYNYYDYKAELGDLVVEEDDPENPGTTKTNTYKNRVITVTAKDSVFTKEGKYQITIANLEAFDGSKQFREIGDFRPVTDTFTADFAYEGFILKPVKIEVVNSIPAGAIESRAIEVVTTDKVLKITFSKPISKSEIQVGSTLANATIKNVNYIDKDNACIVYVPLVNVDAVGGDLVIKLANNVTAVDGDKITAEPSTTDYEKWLGYNPQYRIYAALTLEGTSLIKAKNTASDKIKYELADPVAPCSEITFTFNAAPSAVTYTLYAYDETASGIINAVKVEDGNATVTDKVAKITSSKLLANAAKADSTYANANKFGAVTKYYIDLAATIDGVTVFNTTNPYFPSAVTDTFEKDGITALGLYKAPTTAQTPATNLKCGTLEVLVKPVVLEKTNLIKGANESEYEKIDSLPAGSDVTFEFDTDLTGYKAVYTLYGYKEEKLNNATLANTDIVILDENAEATINEKKVTISGAKLKSKKAVGDIVKYYIELNIATAKDLKDKDTVILYSTAVDNASANVGKKDNSFEKAAKTKGIFDFPTAPSTETVYNSKGAVIVEVAEPDILKETNLIKKTQYSLSDTEYEALDGTKVENAVLAKSEITFTVNDDVDLTGCTAKYELFDLAQTTGGNDPQLISSGNATIAGKVIKVQDNLMVSGNPKVPNKTFNVATSTTTGVSTYYLKLEVAKANGTVIFSSDTKNWWNATNEKDKDRKAYETEVVKLVTTNGFFKIFVAPLAVSNLSYIEENKDSFDNSILSAGKKTYKAQEGIAPKSDVVITFNSTIPSGAKYYWKLYDAVPLTTPIDTSKVSGVAGYETLDAASNTITIQSDKMVASTTTVNDYYIGLIVMNGNDKIFDTADAWFGNGSEYEQAVAANTIGAINATNDSFNVKVLQTQIIKKEVKGVKSVTTRDDNAVVDQIDGFQKSFKSTIKLQFPYDVEDYDAVIYSTAKLYTDNYLGTTHDLTDLSNANNEVKYADFIKDSAEYIYPATVTKSGKVITIAPTSFFDEGQTINIAVFNDEHKYLYNLKDDTTPTAETVVYHTLQSGTSTDPYYDVDAPKKRAAEMFETAEALTVKNAPKIGDGNIAIFSVPATLGTKTDDLSTYQMFVRNDGEKDFANVAISKASNFDATDNAISDLDKTLNTTVDVSRANKILGRFDNTYISTVLGATAFGIRGRSVEVVLIEKNDGAFKAYKATLTDQSKPEKIVVTQTTGAAVVEDTSSGTAGKITVTSVADLSVTPTSAPTPATVNFKFKINGNTDTGSQTIKSVAIVFPGQPNTATPVVRSSATFATEFNAASNEITISSTDAKFFKGDTITLKVKDTSNNEAEFVFTVE